MSPSFSIYPHPHEAAQLFAHPVGAVPEHVGKSVGCATNFRLHGAGAQDPPGRNLVEHAESLNVAPLLTVPPPPFRDVLLNVAPPFTVPALNAELLNVAPPFTVPELELTALLENVAESFTVLELLDDPLKVPPPFTIPRKPFPPREPLNVAPPFTMPLFRPSVNVAPPFTVPTLPVPTPVLSLKVAPPDAVPAL
jgi:hypothetical protein